MNQILTVIPYSERDSWLAEHLLSWLYRLNQKTPLAHCLLVGDKECHAEIHHKLRISAEVTFDHADQIIIPTPQGSNNYKINQTIRLAAAHIARTYRCPWFWLEPACVPLRSDWLESLQLAYDAQPKRYLAGHQDWGTKGEPKLRIARQAVYPPDAIKDIEPLCGNNALFVQNGEALVKRATKTQLIQQVPQWNPETEIREDAVILHRDTSGGLIRKLREQLPAPNKSETIQTA